MFLKPRREINFVRFVGSGSAVPNTVRSRIAGFPLRIKKKRSIKRVAARQSESPLSSESDATRLSINKRISPHLKECAVGKQLW